MTAALQNLLPLKLNVFRNPEYLILRLLGLLGPPLKVNNSGNTGYLRLLRLPLKMRNPENRGYLGLLEITGAIAEDGHFWESRISGATRATPEEEQS